MKHIKLQLQNADTYHPLGTYYVIDQHKLVAAAYNSSMNATHAVPGLIVVSHTNKSHLKSFEG